MPFTSPWNLPKPRTEPTSCALAGGFFTNEPHLKPLLSALAFCNLTFFHQHSTKNLFTSDYSGLPVAYSIAYLNYIKLDCAPTFEYNLLAFLMILFSFGSVFNPLGIIFSILTGFPFTVCLQMLVCLKVSSKRFPFCYLPSGCQCASRFHARPSSLCICFYWATPQLCAFDSHASHKPVGCPVSALLSIYPPITYLFYFSTIKIVFLHLDLPKTAKLKNA